MSTLAAALAEAPAPRPGRRCELCTVLPTLTDEDRAALTEHIQYRADRRYRLSQVKVAEIITTIAGHKVCDGAVGRHRRRECEGSKA